VLVLVGDYDAAACVLLQARQILPTFRSCVSYIKTKDHSGTDVSESVFWSPTGMTFVTYLAVTGSRTGYCSISYYMH